MFKWISRLEIIKLYSAKKLSFVQDDVPRMVSIRNTRDKTVKKALVFYQTDVLWPNTIVFAVHQYHLQQDAHPQPTAALAEVGLKKKHYFDYRNHKSVL